MPENFANKYTTTLGAGVTSGALTGTVASAVGQPTAPFRAIISAEGANSDEIVLVTGQAGTTLTWTRAAEAIAGVQAASAHGIGATLTAIVTADGIYAALYYLPKSNGSDDTATIQTALTNARVAGGGVVKGRPGETYTITAALVIGSKTTLDMTGSTITQANTLTSMLKNYNYLGAGRDTDIEIVGGTWTSGAGTEGLTHRIDLNQVDRLWIHGLRMVSVNGGYAICLSNATYFRVEDSTFDVNSAACQAIGPLSKGVIRNLSGISKDDFVALVCRDWAWTDISTGDVTDVTIENLQCSLTTAGHAVLLAPTTVVSYSDTFAMRRITVRNVKGTTAASAVGVGYHFSNVNSAMSDISISGISAIVPSGEALVSVQTPNPISGLRIENLHIPLGALAGQKAVYVTESCAELTVRGITSSSLNWIEGVAVYDGKTVGRLIVSDINATVVASSKGVTVSNTATVSDLTISNVSMTGAGSWHVLLLTGSGAVPVLNLSNIAYGTGGGGVIYHNSSSTPDVSFSNIRMEDAAGCLFWVISTGNIVLRGSGTTSTRVAQVYRSAAQVLTCYSPDLHVDVSELTPIVGGMAYNTNGARACGVGPVISEGTHWKGLYNGATYP